ncbi:MAG: hypothetical protein ABWZ91_18060 [Nocardioides sp.]
MDPLVALALTAAATLGLTSLVLLVVVARRAQRRRTATRSDTRARAYEQQLAQSQQQIDRLGARVEELSADVARAESVARGSRAARPEQYLITTLADDTDAGTEVAPRTSHEVAVPRTTAPRRPQLGAALEGRIVGSLARHQGVSAVRDRAVDLAVQGVALAHGVRRALNPETLDRAAAEAHVARRRSRRVRRAEVREARRLVRHMRTSDGPVTIQAARTRDVA